MSLAEIVTLDPLSRCETASELVYAGQYEEARVVLGDLWKGVGKRPAVENYPSEAAAEILLQCACLSGFLGDAQATDVHEKAKDLVTEALHTFQVEANEVKVSECNYELGICYYRIGAFDEARIVLQEALVGATPEQHGKIIIGQALVEIFSGRCGEAQETLINSRPFFDNASDALKARWHAHMGLVHRRLAQGRIEHLDRAIMDYTAAIYYYEQAGHSRYCGVNLNNLAFILYRLGRYPEAHEHLDKAHQIFSRLRDTGTLAQVEDTRARAFIAEGKYQDAWSVITGVVEVLEGGGESALLVDALTNKAIIQARLSEIEQSEETFWEAIKVGEESGAVFNAGLAAVSMMEEISLPDNALSRAYRLADYYLAKTQDEEVMSRLRDCASRAVLQLGGPQLTESFSLTTALRVLEAKFIEEALARTGGRITRAARLLGLTHQALHGIIKTRHTQLSSKRTPMKKRLKSIMKKPGH
jgi:tetratricopeptide (TPR) repeat protein